MDAIVIAGGRPNPGEYLYEETGGNYKALLEVGGKPMVQWVLDALGGASQIGKVVIIGLPEDCGVSCARPLTYIPDQGSLLDNIRAGAKKHLEMNPNTNLILSASADIPAINSEMVDWLVRAAEETDHDAYYNVITRQVMEARYPGSRRSYVKLRGAEVCGGDMNVLRARLVLSKVELWDRIVDSRKNAMKQAALIGFDTLLLVLLRLITLDQAVGRVCKRLGLKGRAIVCPYAEIGMDVDKPFQLEIMRADFADHASLSHQAVS